MDLITTGVSASERTRRANLEAAVKDLIIEKMQAGRSTMKLTQVFVW